MNNVLLSLLDVAQFRIILFELEKNFLKLFLNNKKMRNVVVKISIVRLKHARR